MSSDDMQEIKDLVEKNNKLIEDNNKLIHRLNRFAMTGVIMRVVWYGLLIGLPFVLYFYVLEPYFSLFGSSYDVFKTGLNELPGLKGIEQLMDSVFGR